MVNVNEIRVSKFHMGRLKGCKIGVSLQGLSGVDVQVTGFVGVGVG